jgi:hypothetical protein
VELSATRDVVGESGGHAAEALAVGGVEDLCRAITRTRISKILARRWKGLGRGWAARRTSW